MKKPTIVMQSDFGIDSGLVACMHGMCRLVDSELETHDITHLIPAFDIEAASYCLQYTVPFWPDGTVFVSVVDPGVGTSRKASVAKLKNGSYVVTPDNGTLTYLKKRIGVEEIREINEEINRYPLTKDVHTFHGRDLFAYCAARLASGVISFEEVGPAYPVEEIVCHELKCAKISTHKATGHAETQLIERASMEYSKEFLWNCTLYTTAEPCAMCAGAMYWANIGTVVYAMTEKDLLALTGSDEQNPTFDLPCREVFARGQKDITVIGPFPELAPKVAEVHKDYWNN